MRYLFVFMSLFLSLACSESSNNSVNMAGADCGDLSPQSDRFGYLTCTRSDPPPPYTGQPEVIACPDHCAGVAPICITRCMDGDLVNGPQWTCPCSGEPCWRVIGSRTLLCPGCGDGFQEGAELCDGEDLANATCQTLGCTGGTLACTATCTFDRTACTSCPP